MGGSDSRSPGTGQPLLLRKLTGLPVLGKLPRFTEAELEDPEAMAKLVEKHVELDRILVLAGAAEGRH